MRIAGVELFFCHPRRDAVLCVVCPSGRIDGVRRAGRAVPVLWPEEGITSLSIHNGDSRGFIFPSIKKRCNFRHFLHRRGRNFSSPGSSLMGLPLITGRRASAVNDKIVVYSQKSCIHISSPFSLQKVCFFSTKTYLMLASFSENVR